MAIIQREGIDVEKIYSDIVSGKISVNELDTSSVVQSATKARKK